MKTLILLALVLVGCQKSDETTVNETRVVKCSTKPKKDRPPKHNDDQPEPTPVTVIVDVENEPPVVYDCEENHDLSR